MYYIAGAQQKIHSFSRKDTGSVAKKGLCLENVVWLLTRMGFENKYLLLLKQTMTQEWLRPSIVLVQHLIVYIILLSVQKVPFISSLKPWARIISLIPPAAVTSGNVLLTIIHKHPFYISHSLHLSPLWTTTRAPPVTEGTASSFWSLFLK